MIDCGLSRLFHASSVAVVGASTKPDKLGHVILANILAGGFKGKVYPINPKADEVLGLRALPSVREVPGDLDLVVVVVPALSVPRVLREASEKGAGAAVVISGGFRESGREDLEGEIRAVVQGTGLRVLGPNCQGINYRPNELCASWPLVTASGSLAVISQSGTIAATLAGWAGDEGLGVSATVSLGNQLDVSETDLIEFFAEDEETQVVAIYLEGARDGRRFLSAVKRVVPRKPLVVLKGGRTAGGQRAAASHTRSLAGRDEVLRAACRQFGIVRASDVEALYDSAKALSHLSLDGGSRMAVVTSSGGCGILAVDEAERHGLQVPVLPQETARALGQANLLPNATLSNPLDLTVCPAEDFERAVSVLARHDVADVYLLIFGDPIPGATEVAKRVREEVGACVAVSYLGGGEVEKIERVQMHQAGIPVFPAAQRAVRAVGKAVWATRYRRAVAG